MNVSMSMSMESRQRNNQQESLTKSKIFCRFDKGKRHKILLPGCVLLCLQICPCHIVRKSSRRCGRHQGELRETCYELSRVGKCWQGESTGFFQIQEPSLCSIIRQMSRKGKGKGKETGQLVVCLFVALQINSSVFVDLVCQ